MSPFGGELVLGRVFSTTNELYEAVFYQSGNSKSKVFNNAITIGHHLDDYLLIGSSNGMLRKVNLNSLQEINSAKLDNWQIFHITVADNGNVYISGGDGFFDGGFAEISLDTLSVAKEVSEPFCSYSDIAVDDDLFVIKSDWNNATSYIEKFSVVGFDHIASSEAFLSPDFFTGLIFSENNKIYAFFDKTLVKFDKETLTKEGQLNNSSNFRKIALGMNEKIYVSTGRKVWRINPDTLQKELESVDLGGNVDNMVIGLDGGIFAHASGVAKIVKLHPDTLEIIGEEASNAYIDMLIAASDGCVLSLENRMVKKYFTPYQKTGILNI